MCQMSNAFKAAAPNEVIGGKNWNCVSGSAASLHMPFEGSG